MFLSALQPYVVFIIIAVVLLQYAFAIFCLLKLAYMDIDRTHYILWNLLVLIVFFIGGAVFLVYYYKHPELRIQKDAPTQEQAKDDVADEPQEQTTEQSVDEPQENTEQEKPDNE